MTVELPCNIGDTLYLITTYRGILPTKVRTFWIGKIGDGNRHDVLMIRTQDYDIPASDFGVKAFLTYEEAEAALK